MEALTYAPSKTAHTIQVPGLSTPRPTVSCVMVTAAVTQRFAHVQRSIAAYCRQTCPGLELLIVMDRGPADARAAIVDCVRALGRDDVRIVEPSERIPLGALRNLSVRSAQGDFLCQWDDDDLHHPERVERQLSALRESGKQAVLLEEVMQFFQRVRREPRPDGRNNPPGQQ